MVGNSNYRRAQPSHHSRDKFSMVLTIAYYSDKQSLQTHISTVGFYYILYTIQTHYICFFFFSIVSQRTLLTN